MRRSWSKKRGGGAAGEPIAIDTKDRSNWAAWGGRGSEEARLYDAGYLPEASWVGFMLPDLTIPSHDHAGGEEIFILEGEIRDERGHYHCEVRTAVASIPLHFKIDTVDGDWGGCRFPWRGQGI